MTAPARPALTYIGGRWLKCGLSDYIVKFTHMLGSMAARPIVFLAEQKKQRASAGVAAGERRVGWKRFWAILRGLLIALPLLVIVSALASSRFSWKTSIAEAVGITAFCILVFLKGLGVPLPILGSWFGN